MNSRIINVFYDEYGYPFKDQERSVRFPIVGSGFMGANNTTQIKFYFSFLGDSSVTWVAVSKLPNGKIGSKVLQTYNDSELGEPYALLELDSFYTQYKGDIFISLQGYQGGVQVEYDSESELYVIHGTPTIQATGSVKFTNNYATQFVGSGETSNVNFQRILADLGTKLGIRAQSEHVEELPSVGQNDIFYVVKDDPNDPNLQNIYVWNENIQSYVWVGDNKLDLGDYYTKEQGDQFEEEIGNRVTSVENELSSVAQGSPKGVYSTLAALQAAYPTGTTGIYVVSADGHWYYWNGSAWTDGGVYLSSVPDSVVDKDSVNSIQNKAITNALISSLLPFSSSKGFNANSEGFVEGWVNRNGNIEHNQGDINYYRTDYLPANEGDVVFYKLVKNYYINSVAFFNANLQFISGIGSNETSMTIPIYGFVKAPANTKYVIFSFTVQDTCSYVDDQYAYLISAKNVEDFYYDITGDSNWQYGWIKEDGSFNPTSSGWKASPFLIISGGCNIDITANLYIDQARNAYAVPIAFYDKDKNFISTPADLTPANFNGVVRYNVQSPANAIYIRITENTTNGYKCSVKQNIKKTFDNFEPISELSKTSIKPVQSNIIYKKNDFILNNLFVKIDEKLLPMDNKTNGFVTANGQVINNGSDTNWKRTDYIVCKENTKIAYVGVADQNICCIAFFNDSKQFISGIRANAESSTTPLSGTIYAPENTAYVMFSFSNNPSYSYNNDQVYSYYSLSNKLKIDINVESDWLNAWLKEDGQVHLSSGDIWRVSPFIPVEQNDLISLLTFYYVDNNTGTYAVGLIAYDKDKQFVSAPSFSTSMQQGMHNISYTVEQNVKYVRFTARKNYAFECNIQTNFNSVYGTIQDIDEKVGILEEENSKEYIYHFKEHPYGYKKINVIGDSITQGATTTGAEYDNGYVAILRKMLNIEFGGKLNYGFVSAYRSNNPSYEYMWETPIMNMISYTGWTRKWNGTDGFGNDEFSTTSTSAEYQMSLTKTFNYIKLAYIKGYNGVIGVYQGSTLLLSVDTSGDNLEPAMSDAIDISSYQTGTVFSVKMISGTKVAFTGFELGMDESFVTFNNYGRAGIAADKVAGTLLDKETDCDLLIYALGTNNANASDFNNFLETIKSSVKSKTCDKLVLSTCNKATNTSNNTVVDRTKNIPVLKQFAKNIGGDFLSSYDILPKSTTDSTLILENVMQSDGIHPNDLGHALIAEAVSNKLKLSSRSKSNEELLFEKLELHY